MEHLIPHEFFEHRHIGVLFVFGVIALYVLKNGAEWLVEGASGLAYKIGMPEVIVGATVVSLGTTAPECAVSVLAAWNGNPQLALGNAVGSVIADTALIFGVGCLLVALPADKFVLSRQGWVQFGSAVMLAGICYVSWFMSGDQAEISRIVGLVLLGLLVVYMYMSVQWAKAHSADANLKVNEQIAKEAADAPKGEVHVVPDAVREIGVGKLIGLAVLGLVLVIFSGHVLVEAASVGAERVGIPKVVIAATLVALGTSLPELVVGITAIRKGHPGLLVGNVLGADILKILFVIGAAAAAAPLPIIDVGSKLPEIFLYVHLPSMLIILGYFRFITFSAVKKGAYQRWMGIPLLIAYVVYSVIPFIITFG